MAGGHLGFTAEGLAQNKTKSLEQLVTDVIRIAATYSSNIPIIAGGGMFDGKDIARFLKLGAKGIQMGSRFVATHECPVSKKFKELYIAAQEKDLVIIKSPVGMPGRVIRTKFIDKIQNGEKIPFQCTYKCLKSCNIKAAPFCIAQALCNAEQGDMENAVVFAGCGVTKIKKIVSVAQMMDEVVAEATNELNKA
jgi:NAD(P)H-dependent flavin oxidoreductase YrpB (nitropropane dioxygenase family)